MHFSKLVFFAGACFGSTFGCSVINSFDDVKPLASSAGGGTGASGGSTGGTGGKSGSGGQAGGSGKGGSAGATGGAAGDGGAAGTGGTGTGGGGAAGTAGSGVAGHGGGGNGGGGENAGGTAGSGGDAGAGGSAGGVAGMGGTGGTDVGGAAGAGGMAGMSGMGGAGGTGGAPPTGLIVVGGTLKNSMGVTGPVLAVMNPDTGVLMRSDTMLVLGVTHDPKTDIWYILESTDIASGIFPSPTSQMILHARTFDPAAVKWTEKSNRTVPPPPSPGLSNMLSLNDRVVYIGYASSAGDYAAIVLDTSDPTSVTALTDEYFPLTANVLGLAGKRSKLIGGNLEVIARETALGACPADGSGKKCDLSVTPITLGNGGSNPQTKQIVGHYAPPAEGGTPAWAVNDTDSQLVLLLPPTVATAGTGTLIQVDLLQAMPVGSPSTFTLPAMGGYFTQMTVEQCNKVALAADLKAARLYALPLDGSAITSKSLSNSGQLLSYEPYTHTVLTPFASAGQSAFQAFTVVTKPLPATFTERTSDWNPPSDLAVQVMATKSQAVPVCN